MDIYLICVCVLYYGCEYFSAIKAVASLYNLSGAKD